MKLTQFEQSGFIIETNAGYKLAIDIGMLTPLEKLEGITVDAMLVSHLHRDHFTLSHIQKLAPKKLYLNQECIDLVGAEKLSSTITKVAVGDTIDIDGIKVTFFHVDHGPNATLKPKENFGFLIEVDGKKIYFAGDMFYPSGMDVTNLEVDYALIPVGTFYTFGPAEALAFVKTFKKVGEVRAMHYEIKKEMKGEFEKLAKEAGFKVKNS